MNAFEAGTRKMIPAVLVYLRRGDQVLMLSRGNREGDYHAGKWNGLGGKCEADESALEAARREVREEAGIDLSLDALKPLGVLHFPNFKAHRSEDWMVTVFTAELSASVEPVAGPEGALHWVYVDGVMELNLWPGDQHFLPWVIGRRPFVGTVWYEGERVKRHWIAGL